MTSVSKEMSGLDIGGILLRQRARHEQSAGLDSGTEVSPVGNPDSSTSTAGFHIPQSTSTLIGGSVAEPAGEGAGTRHGLTFDYARYLRAPVVAVALRASERPA
jgi:hypothetical protein